MTPELRRRGLLPESGDEPKGLTLREAPTGAGPQLAADHLGATLGRRPCGRSSTNRLGEAMLPHCRSLVDLTGRRERKRPASGIAVNALAEVQTTEAR